jgi:Flp pilus assembly protein TadG
MTFRRFIRDTRGAAAAEFALIVPLMLLFLLGIIDSGIYAWRFNQAEKAAQMGVRYAVVTNAVASGLTASSNNYVNNTACGTTLKPGDAICAAALGKIVCTSTGANCDCAATPCPGTLTRDAAAFTNIADRVKAIAPWVPTAAIQVEYSGSGLGYAGDPSTAIAPIVTVRIVNLYMRPMSGFLVRGTIPLPTIARALTMEDGKGTKAN